MKHFYFLILLITSIFSFSQVQVKGYYRKDGTYVRPHVRTAPNSTVTDNYSYQGNYNTNLEYNTPLPKSTYNYYNNSSSNSNSGKEWVNGYYRKDGTYVSGYYRNKRRSNSNSSYNNSYSNSNNSSSKPTSNNYKYYDSNNSSPIKKYVNTTKVNFRTSPELSDNIIGELEYNDEVTSVSTIGYWDKVKVKRYNPETYNYLTFEGYINSRFLSSYSNSVIENYDYETNNTNSNSKIFKVISSKTYFHTTPDVKNKKNAYLVYGEKIFGIAESKYFVYTEFENTSGIKTVGWILKDDLIRN